MLWYTVCMVLVAKSKPKISVQQKRRHGQHHSHSGHYLRTYWPYLPQTAIVAAGLIFSSLWGAIQQHVLGYATDVTVSGLLGGTNNQRASNGLGGLHLNDKLNQAAQAKANDMVARNYWSHDTPDGNPPW